MQKQQFSELVFSREKPSGFQQLISFEQTAKSTVTFAERTFYSAVSLHALDTQHAYRDVLPMSIPQSGFDLRELVNILSTHFESCLFSPNYVHKKMLVLESEFYSHVKQYMKTQHRALFDSISAWLRNLCLMMRNAKRRADRTQKASCNEKEKLKNKEDHMKRVTARQTKIGGPAELNDLLLTDIPEDPNWFYDASSSPIKTLLLFLYNSGHAYFPFLEHNRLPHSTECPAIMKQAWDDDDDLPDNVKKLHAKLLEEVVTEEAIQARVKVFSERIKLDGILPSCGSCGIRDQFIAKEEVVEYGAKSQRRKRDTQDLFALKPTPSPYVRIGLHNPLLRPLKYTQEQIDERAASGFPEIYSAYEYWCNGELIGIYHLHPQLVETHSDDDEPRVILCRLCILFLQKSQPRDASKKPRSAKGEQNAKGFIDRCYCIARGFDFGNTVGLPELSLLEKILLGQYCFFGNLIKLNAWKGIRQNALRGHVIAFEHSGPNAINRVTHLLFPWYDADEIVQCIRVAFVGPKGVADRCLKALCLADGGLLRVDLRPLLHWLRVLKALHPGYTHIILPDAAGAEKTQAQLLEMQQTIIQGAQRVTSKLSRNIECKAGADIAAVRSLPEDHDCQDEIDSDLGSDAGSCMSSSSDDLDTEAQVDLNDPDFDRKLNFILSDTIIINGTKLTDTNSRDVLTSLLSNMTKNPDTGEVPDIHMLNFRNDEPINEYQNLDVLQAMAFPDLFIFGRGLPPNSWIKSKFFRHLYLQFHNRFATNSRFYFTNFNIMQRHSTASLAVTRVRNSKPAIQEFIRLIHEDTFLTRLNAAVADPTTDSAKLLTKQLLPLISNFGSTIPYSPSERKDMFPRLVSASYRFKLLFTQNILCYIVLSINI